MLKLNQLTAIKSSRSSVNYNTLQMSTNQGEPTCCLMCLNTIYLRQEGPLIFKGQNWIQRNFRTIASIIVHGIQPGWLRTNRQVYDLFKVIILHRCSIFVCIFLWIEIAERETGISSYASSRTEIQSSSKQYYKWKKSLH